MADLSITATNVVPQSGATLVMATAAAAITAGQTVAKNSSGNIILADDDDADTTKATVVGMAVTSGANGGPVVYCSKGDVALGSIVTKGTTYSLSDTPGGICPVADKGSGDIVSLIGVGKSATVLSINIFNSGIAI